MTGQSQTNRPVCPHCDMGMVAEGVLCSWCDGTRRVPMVFRRIYLHEPFHGRVADCECDGCMMHVGAKR